MSTNNECTDDDDDIPSHWPSHEEASPWASTTTSTSEVDQDLDGIDLDDTNTKSSLSSPQHLKSSSLLPASLADTTADATRTKNNTNNNNSERKTTTPIISLAVAADVSQAPIPENASSENHARGGAVALHLSSLLSHISSNGYNNVTSLCSELDPPTTTTTTTTEKDDLTKKHDCNNGDGIKNPDNEKAADGSSPLPPSSSPQKEFVFKRMVHAIDNYFHPPSKLLPHLHFKSPRHHMQGHRLTSMHNDVSVAGHASSSSSSNHACTMNSLPNCQACQVAPHSSTIQEHQHQNQQGGQQQSQQDARNEAHKEQQKHNPGLLHIFENHYKYGSIRLVSATHHPQHQQQTLDTAHSRQKQQQHGDQKQPDDKRKPSFPTRSTRRLPTFAALSTTVASAFAPNDSPTTTPPTTTTPTRTTHDNSQTTTATKQPPPITKQSKSFFPFSFHSSGASSRPKSPPRSSSHRRFSGPLLYGTSDFDEHDAAITTALYVCKLYQMGQDVTRTLHTQNGSGNIGGSDIDDVRGVGEETSGNKEESECIVGDSVNGRSGASGIDGQSGGIDIDGMRDDESSGNEEEGECIVGDSAESRMGDSDINDAREGKTSGNGEEGGCIMGDSAKGRSDGFDRRARHALSSLGFEFRLDTENYSADGNSNCKTNGKEKGPTTTEGNTNCKSDEEDGHCAMCSDDRVTRLYHVPSNTAVTDANRRTFIADGKMFDAVAHVCQATAQEIMAEKCNLAWVTVCDGKGGGLRAEQQAHYSCSKPRSNSVEEWPRDERGDILIREPIRALVGREQPFDHNGAKDRPRDTFLVVTGKGKVRAGIFSRSHLMTTGLEPSTALPLLCEARDRGMNCVVIDPNARGDRFGMDTFETSIRGLFEGQGVLKEEESDGDNNDEGITRDRVTRAIIPLKGAIFVLAHSAAGGQLVRYLLDQQKDAPLLSRIRCITFTDSTHSIQWLKRHPHISTLIQSSKALYVRSANRMRDDDWENASPGDECPKDHFWSHRFGDIKTVWAGTTEHSLSNWTAHKLIWDHFDEIRGQTNEYFAERNGRANNIDSIDEKEDTDVMMTVECLNDGNSQDNEKRISKERVHIGTKPFII